MHGSEKISRRNFIKGLLIVAGAAGVVGKHFLNRTYADSGNNHRSTTQTNNSVKPETVISHTGDTSSSEPQTTPETDQSQEKQRLLEQLQRLIDHFELNDYFARTESGTPLPDRLSKPHEEFTVEELTHLINHVVRVINLLSSNLIQWPVLVGGSLSSANVHSAVYRPDSFRLLTFDELNPSDYKFHLAQHLLAGILTNFGQTWNNSLGYYRPRSQAAYPLPEDVNAYLDYGLNVSNPGDLLSTGVVYRELKYPDTTGGSVNVNNGSGIPPSQDIMQRNYSLYPSAITLPPNIHPGYYSDVNEHDNTQNPSMEYKMTVKTGDNQVHTIKFIVNSNTGRDFPNYTIYAGSSDSFDPRLEPVSEINASNYPFYYDAGNTFYYDAYVLVMGLNGEFTLEAVPDLNPDSPLINTQSGKVPIAILMPTITSEGLKTFTLFPNNFAYYEINNQPLPNDPTNNVKVSVQISSVQTHVK